MHVLFRAGKTPEEVVKRYLQKVRNPPEEVSSAGNDLPLLPTFHTRILFKNLIVELIFRIIFSSKHKNVGYYALSFFL